MFNRLRYDSCATNTEFRDNVSIFSHTLDINRFSRSDPCQHDRGIPGGNTTSTVGGQPLPGSVPQAWGDMIALENDLRGQTRPNSRCPALDYLPKKPSADKTHLPSCQMVDHSNLEDAFQKMEGRARGEP